MKNILYILFLFTLISCKKIDLDSIDNLNNGKIDVIGHGGSGFQSLINPYPTNSFSSIKYAIDGLNVDGIEIDMQISIDSILMIYHEMTLEKSTNCNGCIKQYRASEIENCRYYNQYGSQLFDNASIIKFNTLLSHIQDRSKKPSIYINMKIASPCSSVIDSNYKEFWGITLNKIVNEFNAKSFIHVFDQDTALLNTIRDKVPGIGIVYDAETGSEALEVCVKEDYSATLLSYKNITKEEVKALHDHGIKVYMWQIIKRKDVVEAVNKNPDGLFSDNIPLVQQCLKE